jgi:hypothetical protein
VGNTFLPIAIFFPGVLPVTWRSHRQRVLDVANAEARGYPQRILQLLPEGIRDTVLERRRLRIMHEDQLLRSGLNMLSQRECEEALFTRRVPIGALLDHKSLPLYIPDGENGRGLPLSHRTLEEVRDRLQHYLAERSTRSHT